MVNTQSSWWVYLALSAAIAVVWLLYRHWFIGRYGRKQWEPPSPGLLGAILLCLLATLWGLGLIQNKGIQEMEYLEVRVQSLTDRVSDLGAQLSWQIQEQGNCFESVSCEIRDPNPEEETMELSILAVPKYLGGDIEVWLWVEDTELAMTPLEDGSFRASVRIPMEKLDGHIDYRVLAELTLVWDGHSQTQLESLRVDARDLLPTVSIRGAWVVEDGTSASAVQSGVDRWENSYGISSMTLSLVHNGEILDRRELGALLQSETELAFTLPVPVALEALREAEQDPEHNAPVWEYELVAEYDDSAGFHHRVSAAIEEVREPNAIWGLDHLYSHRETITNAEGEVIYSICD